jgi:hypothetical protein
MKPPALSASGTKRSLPSQSCTPNSVVAVFLCLFATTTPSFGAFEPMLYSPKERSAEATSPDEDESSLLRWMEPYGVPSQGDAILSFSPEDLATEASFFDGPRAFTTGLDWFARDVGIGRHFRFADPRRFSMLHRFAVPASEQYPSTHWMFARTLDPKRLPLFPAFAWRLDGEPAFVGSLVSSLNGAPPSDLPYVRQKRCAKWATPKTVVVTNWGSDFDRLPLVDCDGAIDLFALDRISVLARIPSVQNPGVPLPEEPNPPLDYPDEWIDGVRMLHPRLLWLLQRVGEAFPRRAIHIMSGYRRDAKPTSPHRLGRALDVSVSGIDNADLFAFCMTQKNVGCGYYPFHPFVHIDVRPAVPKPVYWVDTSLPGEPSKYVDSWPYVVESGALAGAGSE